MLYVVLYLVCGVIALVAMAAHTCNVYEGLNHNIEPVVQEINDDIESYYGWKYGLVVAAGLLYVIGLWPAVLVKEFKNYTRLLNAYLEFEEDECPENEES